MIQRWTSENVDTVALERMARAGISDDKRVLGSLLNNRSVYVLEPHDGAFMLFQRINQFLLLAHQYVEPHARGLVALDGLRAATELALKDSGCLKAVGLIPGLHKASRIMASQAGYKRCGVIPEGAVYDGKLCDFIIFEKGRE